MLIKTDFETKPLHPFSLESEDVCEEAALSALLDLGYATKLNKWVKKNLYTYFDYDKYRVEIALLLLGCNEFSHSEFEMKWCSVLSNMLDEFIETFPLSETLEFDFPIGAEKELDKYMTFTLLLLLKVSIANVLYRDENIDIISVIDSIHSATECDDE